jgi:transcriptional regulator with XRE-family HTH domain
LTSGDAQEDTVPPRHRHTPNVRSRRLRAELVRLREAKGLTTEQVAEELEWSRARLSRVETGKVVPRTYDVRALLDLYEVSGDEREELLALSREFHQEKGWWRPYLDVMPEGFDMFVALESDASSIHSFEPHLIPGLLQTEDYARSVLEAGEFDTVAEVDRRVAVRMERQALLTRDDPPEYWAILSETTLRRRVGGDAVMRDQLRRLTKPSREPHINVQVIPFSLGPHPAMHGPFVIFGFPSDPDIVQLETLTGAAYIEGETDLQRYRLAFDHLRAVALPPRDSRALIHAVAAEFDTRTNREDTRDASP